MVTRTTHATDTDDWPKSDWRFFVPLNAVEQVVAPPSATIELLPPSYGDELFERPGTLGLVVARAMARDAVFRDLTTRGFEDLQQGRFSRLEDVQRRLGDV